MNATLDTPQFSDCPVERCRELCSRIVWQLQPSFDAGLWSSRGEGHRSPHSTGEVLPVAKVRSARLIKNNSLCGDLSLQRNRLGLRSFGATNGRLSECFLCDSQ